MWEQKSEHVIVGSLHQKQLISISDAFIAVSILSDDSLPENSFFGLALDSHRHGLLVVVYRLSSPSFSALASYCLATFNQLFLAPLPNSTILNNVVFDFRTLTSLM
ncbi:uncharacterized protein LOC111399047 [Olea europaea subsp. europaea]|uniref:Uncharacterized protein LOC111399047 n=1 Tax=Olea europaea subsp. europaea TaxID=158383 RepID=A0A8S0Q434_OLEEU|nr:uncharacterized protein LOC111399047 [Olea europaea subsp. europaea]